YQQFPWTTVPSTLFASNGAMAKWQVTVGTFNSIKHAVFKIQLTLNSAITLAPMGLWFSKIEVKVRAGQSLWLINDDALLFNILSNVKRSDAQGILKNMGMNADPRYLYTQGDQLPAGTYNFFLPLFGAPWTSAQWYTKN